MIMVSYQVPDVQPRSPPELALLWPFVKHKQCQTLSVKAMAHRASLPLSIGLVMRSTF